MTNIRRHLLHGHPVFLTLVCYQREPVLAAEDHKKTLLAVIKEVKQLHPFHMHAWVILHDHMHLLVNLENEELSIVVQKIKLRFTHRLGGGKRWQRRFWDHICRDEADVKNHMDYIHYNPVKHGIVRSPCDYPWSSFNYYSRKGYYSGDWGEGVCPKNIEDVGQE